jgi:hypothetical protein
MSKRIGISMVMVVCGVVAASAQEADARLEAFFRDYLDAHFEQQPLEATRLGDHRFDHLLDDVSKESREQWEALARRTLRQLPRAVDKDELSRAGRIDFEILEHELRKTLWLMENTRPFEEDPRAYNAYISDGVYMLLTQSTLPPETNIANSIARMAQVPRVVEAAKANLRRPPGQHLETAILQNQGAIGFYETGLFELAGDTEQLDTLKSAAAEVVSVLKEYHEFLDGELRSRADGEWRLGRRKFSRKLELVLDAGYSANDVLRDAEAEFERVRRDLYVLARQLWSRYFAGEPLPPDDPEGRRETTAKVLEAIGREHGKPEELVRDARATVDRLTSFIRENDILRLPEPDRCEIIEMPEFRRGNALAYLDAAPPLEPATASYYAISPPPSDWDAERVRSFLEEYNRHMLQVLSIHEAYPGHYVQLEYANRVPSLIRRVLGSGVYIEGWAVYTEQMMLDQGYGDRDPALRMSQLKFYLRAVANAILDHRMHCARMSEEEALRFLVEDAFQSEGEARLKVVRSKQSSVQLSTYFVGRMAHYRLRQEIQRELEDEFRLGRYHEAVLEQGSVPVKYLPELVRARLNRPQ